MTKSETDELLVAAICEAIAFGSSWTVPNIRAAYDTCGSFDRILAGIQYARINGTPNLIQAIADAPVEQNRP